VNLINDTMSHEIIWVLRWTRKYIAAYAATLGWILAAGVTTLIDPLLIKAIIDVILPRRNFRALIAAAVCFFALYASRTIFNSLGDFAAFRATQTITLKIRAAMLLHLQRLSASFYDQVRPGEILFRIQDDADQLGQLNTAFVLSLARMAVLSAATLSAMLVLNARLTCVIVTLVPVFAVVCRRNRRRLTGLSDAAQAASARMTCLLEEQAGNAVQLQLLGCGRAQARRFVAAGRTARDAQLARRTNELVYTSSYFCILALGITLVLGYGGHEVLQGGLTVGGLVAFYNYLGRFLDPLSGVVDIDTKLLRLGASARRVLGVLETIPAVTDCPGVITMPSDTPGAIEFRNVCFGYEPSRQVLSNAGFSLRAGQTVALAGTSGSGKTTIARLIARLYDVSEGSVLIDGHDLRNVKLRSLRSVVTLVPQETVLLDGTLRENLICVKPKATWRELEEAAELAELRDVMHRLPQGWNAPLGRLGGRLSGGERQRVALARAILKQPRVLLLDESTSALDAETEMRVLHNLRYCFRERLVVLISHRLSAMQWADRVLVVDAGRISDQGSHDQVFRSNGVYRQSCGEREIGLGAAESRGVRA